MFLYPLSKNKKDRRVLHPLSTFSSEQYIESHYDLYLSIMYDEDGGGLHRSYRLHAMQPHSIEMALAYDIKCPKCGRTMKQTGRCLDSHTLGLYECPSCDMKKEGNR